MKPRSESEHDDQAITDWHEQMQLHSASYRVLNSSGTAMRQLAALVVKALVVAALLALAVWIVAALAF